MKLSTITAKLTSLKSHAVKALAVAALAGAAVAAAPAAQAQRVVVVGPRFIGPPVRVYGGPVFYGRPDYWRFHHDYRFEHRGWR